MNADKKRKTALLWTGGKDCALAMTEYLAAGHSVDLLVTFGPENPDFKAHPLPIIKLQAAAMNLPHSYVIINDPYKEGYETALQDLAATYGITHVLTGDIDEVMEQPNWIEERCKNLTITPIKPLWQRDRLSLMKPFLANDFEVILSLVKKPWFDQSWAGRTLNAKTLDDLSRIKTSPLLDLCGENGEYHSVCVSAPSFNRPIALPNYAPTTNGEYHYLKFDF